MSGCGARTVIGCHNTIARSAALLVVLLACFGCSGGASPNHESIAARLGNRCFAVPDAYAGALDAPPFLPGIVSRLGHTHMRLLFPVAELADAVPGYAPEATREIVVGVSVATAIERSRNHHRALNYDEDLWRGTGFYERRAIEPMPKTPYYRVYMTPRNWLLVAADPGVEGFDLSKADMLIANCTIFELSAIPPCAVDVVADDRGWVVEFDLREENVSHRQAVADHVLRKIDSWQRPC